VHIIEEDFTPSNHLSIWVFFITVFWVGSVNFSFLERLREGERGKHSGRLSLTAMISAMNAVKYDSAANAREQFSELKKHSNEELLTDLNDKAL
jgi:hypothetical protein